MTILQDRETRIFSSSILRLVGYGLLLMAVVNISFLIIPLQLTNPLWEFHTVGTIVERMPFILLGIVLVYSGERTSIASLRASIEVCLLKGLSWFSLMSAIVLLLAIPLNINNSFRIYHNNTTADAHFLSQKNAVEEFKEQLLFANSKEEITAIIQQQAQQELNIPDSVNVVKLKDNILKNLPGGRDYINSQIQAFRVQKRSLLIKNCLKWNFGALIAAILFWQIWTNTDWARTKILPNKKLTNNSR